MEIRALRPEDDRSNFHCGDPELDRFFRQFAGQNQFKHHLGTNYVAVSAGAIVGFATVAAGHLDADSLPSNLRSKYPRYPLPILRIARLAVSRAQQRKGCGKKLLRHLFHIALKMSADIGCVGLAADAKPSAVQFYARFGFEPTEGLEGLSASRPSPIPMLIPIAVVASTLSEP